MGFGYVDPVTKEPVITDSLLQGGIVSVYYLGTLCGCLLGGWVGDKVGRIKTIAFGAVWAIFGACLQTSAMNATWMICCMFYHHFFHLFFQDLFPILPSCPTRNLTVAPEYVTSSLH